MNATFDRLAALKLLRLLRKERDPSALWLRVIAVRELLIFESGSSTVSLPGLVLEPGAFTTRRPAFERVLGSFKGAGSLTLQADAARFRLGGFSGQLLDYDVAPAVPDDLAEPGTGSATP